MLKGRGSSAFAGVLVAAGCGAGAGDDPSSNEPRIVDQAVGGPVSNFFVRLVEGPNQHHVLCDGRVRGLSGDASLYTVTLRITYPDASVTTRNAGVNQASPTFVDTSDGNFDVELVESPPASGTYTVRASLKHATAFDVGAHQCRALIGGVTPLPAPTTLLIGEAVATSSATDAANPYLTATSHRQSGGHMSCESRLNHANPSTNYNVRIETNTAMGQDVLFVAAAISAPVIGPFPTANGGTVLVERGTAPWSSGVPNLTVRFDYTGLVGASSCAITVREASTNTIVLSETSQMSFPPPDEDGDGISDVDEGQPAALDTDGDLTPDWQDPDSDGDTIGDADEAGDADSATPPIDTDGDGTADFRDLDSDADCRVDAVEAGDADLGSAPVDTDLDGRPDARDRDSDADYLGDGAEDADCSGAREGAETDATLADTDGDGASDLVEATVSTDPNDPASKPADPVILVPHLSPPAPADAALEMATRLQSVDLYVILDRSGSMRSLITSIRDGLAPALGRLTCPPAGTGDPATCVPDLWAGAGTVGYSGTGGEAYRNHVDVQPNPNFSPVVVIEPGGCCAEPLNFSVWASITGNGSGAAAGCGLTGVNPRTTCSGSPASNAGYTAYGYPCFRQDALPIVILATDEPPISPGDTNKCPNWTNVVLPAMLARHARLMGLYGAANATVISDLEAMATGTGAVDAANGNSPVVVDGGTDAALAVETGVRTLVNGMPLVLSTFTEDDGSDGVDAPAAFIDHLETLQLGTAACTDALTDEDTNGDSHPDTYRDVRTGTPVCWKLVAKPNASVPATSAAQLYRARVHAGLGATTTLDVQDVLFLVPPLPLD